MVVYLPGRFRYKGVAIMNPSDRWDRNIGIRVAIADALSTCTRTMRKIAWAQLLPQLREQGLFDE